MGQLNIDLRPTKPSRMIGYTEAEIQETYEEVKDAKSVLFIGPTGSGKTTFALLLANMITDEELIFQANAVDEGGVDEVRKWVAAAKRSTLSGKRRVNVIDEVHTFSAQSRNALLTEMESKKKSTLWFLTTNEPERLPQVMRDRCIVIETPTWTEAMLLKLAKRAAKRTGKPVPTDMRRFVNPRQLLTYMQKPTKGSVEAKKASATALYLFNVLAGSGGDKRKLYDFKFSSIMEISLAIRACLGIKVGWEEPNDAIMNLVRKTDPKIVARIANACSVALRDDKLAPMVLLDVFVGACAAPFHFEQ